MSQGNKNSARLAGAIDTIVIGAGHAGLSASHMLTEHGVQHVVLERGEIANTWRNERWDSLKLLTPNWQTRLPGYYYAGENPDDYMGMSELVQFMQDYAEYSRTPVLTNTNVTSVRKKGDVYYVTTARGAWVAKAVVVASGACNIPSVPAVAGDIPEQITQLNGHDYRSPEQIAPGGVLVVGASASGMQIADELLQAGHEVKVTFTSQVVPVCRGIMSTLYGTLAEDQTEDDVLEIFRAFYADDVFVRVLGSTAPVGSSHVRGTNYCNLVVSVDPRLRRLRIVSYIDNLVKGQAGSALQNMNLLFGFAENAGLDRPGMYP